MKYRDPLYGEWELPQVITKIAQTKEMARLRNISQAVLPNNVNPHGPIPSRFHHGLGVAYLARVVEQNNMVFEDDFLMVAGLLHDAGNPPFSHLSEPFLFESTGKDGESFLEEMLVDSEISQVLKEHGVNQQSILNLITGKMKPFSDVINGSMDIDNLDNVGRYNHCAGLGAAKFNAVEIARCLKYWPGLDIWYLENDDYPLGCYEQAMKWKQTRRVVYGAVYGSAHLCAAMMIYRAMEFAHCEGKLNLVFFKLDDYQAIEFLLTKVGRPASSLVESALNWQWFKEIYGLELDSFPTNFPVLISYWLTRKKLADLICKELKLPQEEIAVLVSKGKEKRKITLPFHTPGGVKYDPDDGKPIFKIKVYAKPGLEMSSEVKEIVRDFIT